MFLTCRIDLEPVFFAGSIPETSYNVSKDQKYCGELKVALTFNPEELKVMLIFNPKRGSYGEE
ncbi:C2 domain-containing protein, partial [Mucuna pruriens]